MRVYWVFVFLCYHKISQCSYCADAEHEEPHTEAEEKHMGDQQIYEKAKFISASDLENVTAEADLETHVECSKEQWLYNIGVDTRNEISADFFHNAFMDSDKRSRELDIQAKRFEKSARKTLRMLGLNKKKFKTKAKGFLRKTAHSDSMLPRIRLACKFRLQPNCDDSSSYYRTADGTCNNKLSPRWGSAETPFARLADPDYDDGLAHPRTLGEDGDPLPLARKISTIVHEADSPATEDPLHTHMVMTFGQFLDHDVTLTPVSKGFNNSDIKCCDTEIMNKLQYSNLTNEEKEEVDTYIKNREACFVITIPDDDPTMSGRNCMNFIRSAASPQTTCTLGPREQLNRITSYIDASNVYGSSVEDMEILRSFQGGKLRVLHDESELSAMLPPLNPNAACGFNKTATQACFKAGDVRCNEISPLAAIHTLFMREHNRITDHLANSRPELSDETLFEEARRILGAIIQHITYIEFLPAVLGKNLMEDYKLYPLQEDYYEDYSPFVNPSIFNEFATAAFRMGHSHIRDTMSIVDVENNPIGPALDTKDEYFKPSYLYNGNGADALIRGLLVDATQATDRFMSNRVTEHLFEVKGVALDLAALNIQRGRDHGLPSYSAYRQLCGLSVPLTFGELTDHDETTREKLSDVYKNVTDIDLFTGGVSELAVEPGSLIGPTFGCIIAQQFSHLKNGDRFYYENNMAPTKFSTGELAEIRKIRLASIICNVMNVSEIQPNVFLLPSIEGNSRVPCSSIPNIDLSFFTPLSPGKTRKRPKRPQLSQGRRQTINDRHRHIPRGHSGD